MTSPIPQFNVSANMSQDPNSVFDLELFRTIRKSMINKIFPISFGTTTTICGPNEDNVVQIDTDGKITLNLNNVINPIDLETIRTHLKTKIQNFNNKDVITESTFETDLTADLLKNTEKFKFEDKIVAKKQITYLTAYMYVMKFLTILYIHILFMKLQKSAPGAPSVVANSGIGPGGYTSQTSDEISQIKDLGDLYNVIKYNIDTVLPRLKETQKATFWNNLQNQIGTTSELKYKIDEKTESVLPLHTYKTMIENAITALKNHGNRDQACQNLVNLVIDSIQYKNQKEYYNQQLQYFVTTYPLLSGMALPELVISNSALDAAAKGGKRFTRKL